MHLRAFTLGLSTALLPALALAAPLTQTTTATFSGGANVQTVTDGPGASANNATPTTAAAAFPAINLNQFNTATGVLIGVDLNLTSTRTQSGSGAGNGSSGSRTATGTGGATGMAITAPGASQSFGNLSNTGGCASTSNCSFSVAAANTATNATMAVNVSSLGAYAGAGTVAVTRAANLSAMISLTGYTNGSYSYNLNWNGSLAATYSYLAHSNAAFDLAGANALTLDFGSVQLGASVAGLDFDLYNLISILGDTAALDLDGVVGSGDTGVLTTDLAAFADLAAGAHDGFHAMFDTSTIGQFEAQYIISLSDGNTGVGQLGEQLTLILRGEVVAPSLPNNGPQLQALVAVPEPAALAVLGLGLTGFAIARRRRAS